jgi:hypothetical protein
MVLSGSKKSTYMSSIVNQNQGGGNKKAGLLTRSVGSFTSVFLSFHGSVHGNCCTRSQIMKNRFSLFPNQNLPVGLTAQSGCVKRRCAFRPDPNKSTQNYIDTTA